MRHFKLMLFVVMVLAAACLCCMAFGQDTMPAVQGALVSDVAAPAPAAPASNVWDTVWAIVTSATFISLCVLALKFADKALHEKLPAVAKAIDDYGGYAVTAVRWAEKFCDGKPGWEKQAAAARYLLALLQANGQPINQAAIEKEVSKIIPDAIEDRLASFGLTPAVVAQMLAKVHASLESKAAL